MSSDGKGDGEALGKGKPRWGGGALVGDGSGLSVDEDLLGLAAVGADVETAIQLVGVDLDTVEVEVSPFTILVLDTYYTCHDVETDPYDVGVGGGT